MMTEFLRVIIWNPGAVVAETEQNRLNRARRALELMFAVPGRDGNPEFAADSLPALLASLLAAWDAQGATQDAPKDAAQG